MADVILTTEVTDLLSKKWAFLSGGRTLSNSRIISLCDTEQPPDEVCTKLFKYLFDVTVELDEDAKFVLVIDLRKGKWSNIKPFLNFVQNNFPNTSRIEKIFLLQPLGMFSSLFRFVPLNMDNIKIESISSISDLHKKLDRSQLTTEFDGIMEFIVNEWIDDRKMIESIQGYIGDLKRDLEELTLKTDGLMSSFPEVVRMSRMEIRSRMDSDNNAFELLNDKIKGSRSNTKASLDYFHSRDEMPSKLDHAVFLERLQLSLDGLKTNSLNQSEKYRTFMGSALKSVELSERVDQVSADVKTHLTGLSLVKVVGCSSLDDVQSCMDLVKNIENSSKSSLQESEGLVKEVEMFTGQEMSSSMSSGSHINGDSFPSSMTESSTDGTVPADLGVREQLNSRLLDGSSRMNNLVSELKSNLQFAFKELQKTQEAVLALDKAREWNKKGEELVGCFSTLVANSKSYNKLRSALAELKSFRETSSALDSTAFRSRFPGTLDELMLEKMSANYSKCAELQVKIDRLIQSLALKIVEFEEKKRSETIKKIQEEQLSKEETETDGNRPKASSLPIGISKHRKLTEPKIVVDSRVIPGMVLNDKNKHHKFSIVHSRSDSAGHVFLPAEPGYDSVDVPRNFHLLDIKQSSLDDMEKYIPPRLREDLLGIQPVPDSGTIRRKRSHVIQELIETERVYTSDLRNIIEGYYNQFDNPELQDLVPEILLGKRDTLFGNIIDIYNFHSEIFLKSLEACEHRTGDVGKCFIENKERLQLYSIYCQNKIQAEQLLEKVGDNNAFFRECQKRLNHPLPFSSYILKPVQRITKYHLLVKELARMTTNESETIDLKRAIMAICDVLRYVNNSMHQLSISGFSGSLVEQGRLLMQGSLDVNVEKRKERGSVMKQTFHKRQVFLYERCILFCKKKDQPTGLGSYVFKCLLKTDEVGPLVESPRGGDEKRFELWSKNEVWSFIAPTPHEKLDWTEEIKKVLYEQMDLLRTTHKRLLIDSPLQGVIAPNPTICSLSNEPDSLISNNFDSISDT